MAIGKTPNITQQLLSAAKIQVDAFADANSQGGRSITWSEMNAIKTAFDADPATARALDGGPTTYSKEARSGLAKLLGGKAMEPAARATFLRMMGALPDDNPGDEIVALYAVAIRRAADAVRADPTNPEKLATARMLSAHAAATLTPVAPLAMTNTQGTGIVPRPGRGATVFSTASATDTMRGSSETRQGITASVNALKDLNKAIQGN